MKMVEVGMQVNVEVGAAEEKKNKKNDETDGSSEVVHWERFLPRMVLRVLLVEADDSTRQIIAALLRKCSYKVVAAVSDGLEAWETLKDQPHSIDLILTAVELPSISGFALLSLVMEHDICKHIPVIMMSSEDSFSMVVKCMLKGAADFLIKPVRRNELRNLWQHVWRRHMLAGGGTPHNLPTTDENNAESNQSSDHRSSTPKTKGESDTQDRSQGKYTSSNLSDTGRELQGNVVKLGQESLKNEGRAEGISDKLFIFGNSKRFVKEVARCNDTCESIASKLEENSASVKGMVHDDAVGIQSDRENSNVMIRVGCNENLMESSTEAIDFIGSFDKQPMGAFAVSGLTDGAKKLDISPQLELSLRRSCLSSSNNHGTSERHILNHSDASAFSRYNSSKSLQPIFPTLAGNREVDDSKPTQDLESNNDTSPSHVGTLGDSWENLPNPVKSQSETSSNSRLGPFSVTGARINIMSAGSNSVFPYHAQSGLPPACSPKQDGKKEYSPLPASTSEHSDTDIHDSKQGNHWRNEATNSSVDQSVQGLNKKEPVEELRCSSLIVDQGTCSHICNDVTNHEKRCAHGGDFSRSNASGGAPLAASIDRGTTTESFDDGNRFLHDGLKGMDTNRLSQREAALTKFRLKRKDRCFEKKVRYQNRKRLAEQRPRVKGQFVRQVQNDPPVDDSDSPKI